ncbi:MAG TPA: protein phosphatase 2C domain-containing protein [Acidocella sp.]|nr:MAG: protein phosphatase [Acidocella sp. 20-58-15]HQT38224.1 protein phosphatase 2C domain-containing protein [Acidocella sp.]
MTATKSWALSDPGAVRKYNEDNLLSRPDLGLWVVADGAGGHDSGEVASGMIVEELARLPSNLPTDDLIGLVDTTLSHVHAALRTKALTRGNDVVIASTFIALVVRENNFTCLWAGDSRAYLLRNGMLSQLTRDHSLVQELVDLGKLAAADAESHPHANIITRAVGSDSDRLDLDRVNGAAKPGDRFLLCSDGLSKTLTQAEITQLLSATDGEATPKNLIAAALGHRVRDNVTAIVVEINSE